MCKIIGTEKKLKKNYIPMKKESKKVNIISTHLQENNIFRNNICQDILGIL